jgi:putative transposase
VPLRPNERWSLDSDQLTDGRRFRILAIVDDCTRECLALVADTSLSGLRVARELDQLIAARGKPKMIVSDNGSELTSNAILAWADQGRVEMALYRSRQANAEWLHRELQRAVAR